MPPNKYAGQCHLCHGQVAAGQGLLLRSQNGWIVQHAAACPVTTPPPASHHRVQLWEECPRCGQDPVGTCGYCEKHCHC